MEDTEEDMVVEVDMAVVADEPNVEEDVTTHQAYQCHMLEAINGTMHIGRHATTTSAKRNIQKEVVRKPERVLHLRLQRGGVAHSNTCPIKKEGHQNGFTYANYMQYDQAGYQFCKKAIHKNIYPSFSDGVGR